MMDFENEQSTTIISTDLRGDSVRVVQERYKVIPNFPDYEVSIKGSIRRIGKCFPIEHKFSRSINHNIEYTVAVFKDGKRCKINPYKTAKEVWGKVKTRLTGTMVPFQEKRKI